MNASDTSPSAPPDLAILCRFLQDRGFVMLTFDHCASDLACRCEAWAYHGPLDFEQASAVCFGLGADPVLALHALAYHLIRHDRPTPRT